MKRSLAAWAVGVVPMGVIPLVAAAIPSSALAAPSEPPPGGAAPRADGAAGGAGAGASIGASGAKADSKPRGKTGRKRVRNADFKRLPWIRRWAPQRHLGEIGISAGAFIPNERHDLYDPVTRPPEPFWIAGPDVAVRAGYYPLRSLGVEAEFNAMPTRLRNITDDFAFTYGFQAHAVFQLPYYSVVPFFLVGGGLLGVRSNPLVLGDDVDPALHYGAGVKIHVTRVLGLRFEARNIMSAIAAQQDGGGGNVQVLGGLTFTIGRRPPPAPPLPLPPVDQDRDKDGFRNDVDECPDQAGIGPHGCPDTDGDTFRDTQDDCPEVPGVAPRGCPVGDTDLDGFVDPEDDCIFEPENKNNYLDDDGCPDDLPPEVKKFAGTIDGIEFDTKKDTIRPVSKPVLDKAVAVLEEFTDVKVNIVGHTDDVGAAEFNLDLSRRRAESVKKYLVDAGIDASRITTEGRGMTQPRVPNDSAANRALNRRIEFEVSSIAPTTSTTPPPVTTPDAASSPGAGGATTPAATKPED
jgi:outer membrane protein OmpA-like peptidoglycan-associated protein